MPNYAQDNTNYLINEEGSTIQSRFLLPKGYSRIKTNEGSFEKYLQDLPLKPHGTKVKFYDGKNKVNRKIYIAVIDMDIGTKDLQQCADAVMRLRGEYLYKNKRYNEIHFNFTNGFNCEYLKWMEGNRIHVEGNKTWWVKKYSPSNTYENFQKYMEQVFMFAGTFSLSKELVKVEVKEIKIGDVFIQGGSPGHAVIVVDMAENKTTGDKIFLLAQSYMPAQDIQVLQNPKNRELNPWYSINFGNKLVTPQWDFTKDDLKRFKD